MRGARATASALVWAAALATGACGDPLLVLGDVPGTMRLVAGVPDSAGTAVGATPLESLLGGPRGLAADAEGTVFVASHDTRMVQRFRAGEAFEVIADVGTCAGSLCIERPTAVLPDGLGALYISDRAHHAVFRLSPGTGTLELIAGDGSQGVSPDGVTAAGSPLAVPAGLALDPSGRLYIAESGSGRVRRVESDGTLRTVAGSGVRGSGGDGGPATAASLGSPSGLALHAGVLYIADALEHRVRAVDLASGVIETLAGSGTDGFGGDGGPARDAALRAPAALTVALDGRTLFIADTENHRVRRVNLSTGVITTFAGTGDTAFNGDLMEAGGTSLSQPRGVAATEAGQLYIADTGHHVVWRTTIER
ncbi:MAG TPA: hypothetical protein VML95_11760 [Longimicrobiales bacterium]|nr:hypothetical protein [Longimicrobiales bacterium]